MPCTASDEHAVVAVEVLQGMTMQCFIALLTNSYVVDTMFCVAGA